MNRNSLLVTSALVSIAFISCSENSYAACTAVGSVVTCTGSSATNTSTQSFSPLNNAELTASAGFGVNAGAGNAITVSGAGAISYTDTNTINSVDLTANAAGGNAIDVTVTGDDGTTLGAITINSNSKIIAHGRGLELDNDGLGKTNLTINGNITSTNNDAILIDTVTNSGAANITIGEDSTITSSTQEGIVANLDGSKGTITINGNIAAELEAIEIDTDVGTGDINVITAANSSLNSDNDEGIDLSNTGVGETNVTINGILSGDEDGLEIDSGANVKDINVTIGDNATITGNNNDGIDIDNNGTGSSNITINGTVTSNNRWGTDLQTDDNTKTFTLLVGSESKITGDSIGVGIDNDGVGSTIVTVNGNITGTNNEGLRFRNETSTQDLILTVASGASITGNSEGINIDNDGVGNAIVTINGNVTGVNDNAIDFLSKNASSLQLYVGSTATIESKDRSAITAPQNTVLNMTIDGGTIIGTGGTALDMNDNDDILTIKGDLRYTGDLSGGTGTGDVLYIEDSTPNPTSGSSLTSFEAVNVTGILTSKAGTDVDINSTTSVNVRGGVASDIASASSFGKVTASNGFTFSNGAKLSITTSGREVDIVDGTILNDVLSGGAITGLTSGVLSDDNPAYKFTSIVNGTDVDILVSKPDLTTIGFGSVSTFANVISNISQTTLDSGLRSVISDIIDAPDDATRETYIKTLLPESNNSKFNVTSNVLQKSFSAAQTRMSNVRNLASSDSGLSAGDNVNIKSTWFSFFHKDIGQGYRDGEFGYDSKIKGVTLGFDFYYGEGTIIGSSFSYANSDIETRVLGSDSRVDSQNLIFYVSHDLKNNLYLNLLASAGLSQVEATRELFDSTLAFSDYDGYQLGAEATLGYSTNLKRLNLMPYLSAKYNYVAYDNYTEDGSSAPLSVDSTDLKSFESELGIEVSYPFIYKNTKYVPKASLGWQHDFINDDIQSNASFVAQPSTSFSSSSNSSGRDLFNLGLGIDINAIENMDISFDYKLEAKKEFKAHSTAVNAKFSF